jgi:hypothetical protein
VLLHTGGNLSSVMGREGPGYDSFPRSVKRMYGWSRGSDYIIEGFWCYLVESRPFERLPCELPVVLSKCGAPMKGTALPLPELILDKVGFTLAKSEDGFNDFQICGPGYV